MYIYVCFLFEKIDFRTLFSLTLAFQVIRVVKEVEENWMDVGREKEKELKLKRTFQQLLLKCRKYWERIQESVTMKTGAKLGDEN